jgi:hypothetical protein
VPSLVIGVPARNEASTIARVGDYLERGAALVGEMAVTELVLGYQTSEDDTLAQWRDRSHRIRQRVLECERGATGKGRNVKLIARHCVETEADLLLVDADLRHYEPSNVARFVSAAYRDNLDFVLPLWCRQWGHGNSTNYLASPLLRALYGARVRQPLAGHMFIGRSLLQALNIDALPDDYGVDIALTMSVLDWGGRIGQVPLSGISFEERQINSEEIMRDVASAMLARVSNAPGLDRNDVTWPKRYWEDLQWPSDSEPSIVERDGARGWVALGPAAPTRPEDAAVESHAQTAWCAELASAVRAVRRGASVRAVVEDLVEPFFAHASTRSRQARPAFAEAEAYVHALGDKLSEALP